jgi:cytochrome c oxidase cbb3-type subunit 1
VALRFAAISIISFAFWGILNALTSLRCAQSVLHFTQFGVGMKELFLLGFVASALFAGVYSVVPRLAGREFPCCISPQAHWLFTTGGIAMMTLAFLVGGWIQGWQLASPSVPFAFVTARLHPWLLLHAAGLAVFTFGQLALAANAAWLLFECVKPLKDPVVALFSETAAPAAGK